MTASPPFRCELQRALDRATVVVAGEVDLASVPTVDATLADSRADDVSLVVLDLSAVSFIDSSGVHLLVRWTRIGHRAGFRLCVVAPPEGAVARVLELTGVAAAIDLADTSPAAAAGSA